MAVAYLPQSTTPVKNECPIAAVELKVVPGMLCGMLFYVQ